MSDKDTRELQSKELREMIEKSWSLLPLTHYQRYTRPEKIVIEKDTEGKICVVLIVKVIDKEFHMVAMNEEENKREKAILLSAINREAKLITIDKIELHSPPNFT